MDTYKIFFTKSGVTTSRTVEADTLAEKEDSWQLYDEDGDPVALVPKDAVSLIQRVEKGD